MFILFNRLSSSFHFSNPNKIISKIKFCRGKHLKLFKPKVYFIDQFENSQFPLILRIFVNRKSPHDIMRMCNATARNEMPRIMTRRELEYWSKCYRHLSYRISHRPHSLHSWFTPCEIKYQAAFEKLVFCYRGLIEATVIVSQLLTTAVWRT